jgi:Flp pilus assembly protein TadD
MVAPKDRETIRQAISEALKLDPNDALSHALAGRIALEDEDPSNAIEQLKEAVRLRPTLAEAHYSLMTAYKKLGRLDDANGEADIFRQIREQNPDADNNSTAEIREMLFSSGERRPATKPFQ